MFIFKASSLSAGSAAKFFEDLSFLRNFPKTLFTITNLNNNKANPQLSALSHYCEETGTTCLEYYTQQNTES